MDNTSDQDIADAYPRFLGKGISIVTPNKKAFSGNIGLWRDIFTAARSIKNPDGGLVYHESSVGAGLPIISTLKDLVETGDEITKIEGIFSGTMSYLCNNFHPFGVPVEQISEKWSDIVTEAKRQGYTEPDPRDDLNGMDVARKLVILARVAGVEVESIKAFPVQSLIPKELESVKSAEEFLAALPRFDNEMNNLRMKAEDEVGYTRYVGRIDFEKEKPELTVGLETVHKSHAFANLTGSDNFIMFYTKRYGVNPLVVKGAG